MLDQAGRGGSNGSPEPPHHDRDWVKWLESQPTEVQVSLAQAKFEELLLNAAQPRHASSNACIKLCYWVEQCMSSKSLIVRNYAFLPKNCVDMFEFYIEWNEKNQNRSMRQVLELVSSLITQSPDLGAATGVKMSILNRCISIIAHQAAQPLVKPAFKALEYLLSKRTISTNALIEAYSDKEGKSLSSVPPLWDTLFLEVFDWMNLSDISPAAGKFLVTVFKQLRNDSVNQKNVIRAVSWQRWIQAGLSKDARALENVKNYILLPLFKLDRHGSLIFLDELIKQESVVDTTIRDLDSHSLLQLAAIEVGKKAGLVEEPNTIQFKVPKKSMATVLLKEDIISGLLSNASDLVRSLAFSVLVSSSSPIRPFTTFALRSLQQNLSDIYSDTDAKFRNEVLSNTKHMIDRLRGVTGFLVREIDNIKSKDTFVVGQSDPKSQMLQVAEGLLLEHTAFIEWFFLFLLQELIPTTSYQRHITSLKALELLLKSGILQRDKSLQVVQKADNDTVWPYSVNFFTPYAMRLLLDLLMDPFEDVRNSATAILKYASVENYTTELHIAIELSSPSSHVEPLQEISSDPNHQSMPSAKAKASSDLLRTFISRAEENSKRTGRADYADGVARSYELLYGLQTSASGRFEVLDVLVNELEDKVAIAERDLAQAVLSAPIHGSFAALSLVWNAVEGAEEPNDFTVQDSSIIQGQLEMLQQRIVDQCHRIWKSVKDILCNDSPEGHLPQELDEVEAVDTKDVLSYSFRAIHESSNLLRVMINKLPDISPVRSSLVTVKIFTQIGDLTFDQLSNLRHRGAFSTVSLTFARCCLLTQVHASALENNILGKWYQGALDCILDQVSTTRRSAGIPALLTGIMAANSKEPAFQEIFSNLKYIAQQPAHQSAKDETSLPQVHAMNSLKETFKSSVLGRRSEGHIGECLQIAVDSLKSEIWAIRNCGLLLLRSLIDCLFGTSDSKTAIEAGWDGKSIKISYEKYPTLPEMLMKLLSQVVNPNTKITSEISTVESVFPALDIIRRAGPPTTHGDEIFKLVLNHLGSRVWNVREMSSHAISVLVPQTTWVETTRDLLKTLNTSHNFRHGSLMAVRFILERQTIMDGGYTLGALGDIVDALVSSWDRDTASGCPEIYTAHIEARNALGRLLVPLVADLTLVSEVERCRLLLFSKNPYHRLVELTNSSPYRNWHPACIALTRMAIFNTVLSREYGQLALVFEHAMQLGTDVALAALICIPGSILPISAEDPVAICQAYIATIINFDLPEVRAATLEELFGALRNGLRKGGKGRDDIFPLLLMLAESLSKSMNQSPSLQNAELQMSGWLLLAKITSIPDDTEQISEEVKSWTQVLNFAGRKTEDFDTRLAAASALGSFYANVQDLSSATNMCMVTCHLALYDCLNDDDSDIREIAAKIFSEYVSKSLMPLAAQEGIAGLLLRDYASCSLLVWNVVSRMTGSLELVSRESHVLEKPSDMFRAAINVDNTLFVEEDQNLFIDEVREVKFWSSVFKRLLFQNSKDSKNGDIFTEKTPVMALLSWTLDAIKALNGITQGDGILGWTSKPAAFSACMRTIICANTLLSYELHGFEDSKLIFWQSRIQMVLAELQIFLSRCTKTKFHEGLVAELAAEKTLLALSRPLSEARSFRHFLKRI